eukprot:6401829-Pyramimonas_sp.AAC.1
MRAPARPRPDDAALPPSRLRTDGGVTKCYMRSGMLQRGCFRPDLPPSRLRTNPLRNCAAGQGVRGSSREARASKHATTACERLMYSISELQMIVEPWLQFSSSFF